MKKVSLFMNVCLIVCLMLVNTAYAQNDDYQVLIVRMMKAGATGNGANLDNYAQPLIKVATEIVKQKHSEMSQNDKTALATQLVEIYMQEQIFDDMSVAMKGYFEKHVSLDEMKLYVGIAESERFQDVNKRMSAFTQTVPIEIMPNLIMIAQGKTPEAITAVECTVTYKEKFNIYYEKTGSNQIINQIITSVSAILHQTGDSNTEKNNKILNPMMEYLKNNFRTMMLNGCIKGNVTEEDLQYFIEVTQQPAYNGVMEATQEMVSDIMNFGKKIITYFASWLKEQNY